MDTSNPVSPEKTTFHVTAPTVVNVSVHSGVNNEDHTQCPDVKCLPLDLETVVSPPNLVSTQALKEEEEEVADSAPVTPVTPLCIDHQQQQQLQQETECNSHFVSSNNSGIIVIPEEPEVVDINNIQHPRDLVSVELQYSIADINILDTAGLDTTNHLPLYQSKLENNFEGLLSPEVVTEGLSSEGKIEMYRVDTTDRAEKTSATVASLSNGHSSTDHSENSSPKVGIKDMPTFGRLASKEFDVVVNLDSGEKRFGFSVIGGIDEGFPARVESIAGG